MTYMTTIHRAMPVHPGPGAGEGETKMTQNLAFYRMMQKLLILRKKIMIEKDRL